ncbi:helix-turn-helix domain-containing protein [Kribbella sp. NPDC049584]|uniref:helix-turn-helix domain-containing protein n=1 Tax=Kribbella sp. NPDC049584 TaxID=3154833 RepID=UPI003424531B
MASRRRSGAGVGNTVRYRLRRVEELTGRSLTDPRQATELSAAAYAARLLPLTTPTVDGNKNSSGNAHRMPARGLG